MKAAKQRDDVARDALQAAKEKWINGDKTIRALNRQVEFFKTCYGLDDSTDESIMEHLLKRKRLVRVTFTKVRWKMIEARGSFCSKVKKKIFEVVAMPPEAGWWDEGVIFEEDLVQWKTEVIRSCDGCKVLQRVEEIHYSTDGDPLRETETA